MDKEIHVNIPTTEEVADAFEHSGKIIGQVAILAGLAAAIGLYSIYLYRDLDKRFKEYVQNQGQSGSKIKQ